MKAIEARKQANKFSPKKQLQGIERYIIFAIDAASSRGQMEISHKLSGADLTHLPTVVEYLEVLGYRVEAVTTAVEEVKLTINWE